MTEEQASYNVGMENPLSHIFAGMMAAEDGVFRTAIQNLAALPSLDDVKLNPMPGKPFPKAPFDRGVMGFRRLGRHLTLAFGCGTAMVRQVELGKYIAMVQAMKNKNHETIVLENFIEGEDGGRMPRGQVLGRIVPEYSAVLIVQGLSGRVIHSPADIVKSDVYYIGKEQLTAFYISSKLQQGNEETLDELAGAFDGWKAYNLPASLDAPQP